MRHAPRPPECRVEDAWVVRVHRKIVASGVFTTEQDVFPCLAAIARAVDSTLLIRSMGVPQCRDIHQVRVLCMDAYSAYLARVFQSQVIPCLAPIGCLPDATSCGTKIKHLWIGWITCYRYNTASPVWAHRAPFK